MTSPGGLTLLPEHRPGHGGPYDNLNRGCLDGDRLRMLPAGLPLPRSPDGRLVLAVDMSPWLRSDAPRSPERLFHHVHGRNRRSSNQSSPRPRSHHRRAADPQRDHPGPAAGPDPQPGQDIGPRQPPADWKQQTNRRDHYHNARVTTIITAAFIQPVAPSPDTKPPRHPLVHPCMPTAFAPSE
ncbi:transposase [Streptomyces sp. tea 10]|nr:transposase [Streptomyces sp. tea 10]